MDGEIQNDELGGFDSYELKLGDMLRGERATMGKSLLDVQRDLRIKAAYISAIENCDPSVFPNPGFVAGYVRSYARYLKLDPEDIFRAFCTESGFTGVNADVRPARTGGGTTRVLAGPALAGKDDAILKAVPMGGIKPSVFSEISLSAVGSVLVLALLVGGLGYGGYRVVNAIQTVEIAPVNQTPVALDDLELADTAPATEAGAELVTASAEQVARDNDLARLYQPRELEIPVVATRDGPIAEIDPDTVGTVKLPSEETPEFAEIAEIYDPVVREVPTPPTVNVIAEQPAWVRVYLADGSILFEKILDKGEAYELPLDVEAPLLRAGNAGAVYLLVDGRAFGPVGKGANVVKQVSLVPDDITSTQTLAETIPDPILESTAMQAVLQE